MQKNLKGEMIMINEKLYHLTSEKNLENIIKTKKICTANSLKKKFNISIDEKLRRFSGPVNLNDEISLNYQIYIPDWGISDSNPDDFFVELDSYVFFWNDEKYKMNMKNSKNSLVQIEIESKALLKKYSNSLHGCVYNSGSFFNINEKALKKCESIADLKMQYPKVKYPYLKSTSMFLKYNDQKKKFNKSSQKQFDTSSKKKIREVLIKNDVDLEGIKLKVSGVVTWEITL